MTDDGNIGLETLFDVLIPIEMPQEARFVAPLHGGHYLNEEVPFSFGSYEASFHRLEARRYMVVRLGLPEHALPSALTEIFKSLARAAVALDISIRPLRGPINHAGTGCRPELDCITFFPAGERPLIAFRSSSSSIGLPTEFLSEALSEILPQEEFRNKALEMFGDIDFEASTSSRFALLSTILELLAERQPRDAAALVMIDRWMAEATAAGRQDLVEALRSQRTESIGAAIGRLVEAAATSAECSADVVANYRKAARNAYRKRSQLLHKGTSLSNSELAQLRAIVRLVLTSKTAGTPFTAIANLIWAQEDA